MYRIHTPKYPELCVQNHPVHFVKTLDNRLNFYISTQSRTVEVIVRAIFEEKDNHQRLGLEYFRYGDGHGWVGRHHGRIAHMRIALQRLWHLRRITSDHAAHATHGEARKHPTIGGSTPSHAPSHAPSEEIKASIHEIHGRCCC